MADFNFHDFVVEVYSKSEPSVDFDSAEKMIPWNHRLSMDVYEEILSRHCGDDRDLIIGCNMFMLDKGPQLYE